MDFCFPQIILTVSPGTGRRTLQKKRSVADGMIDPDRDLYAIPSQDGNDIYFLSLVDILTHYGKNTSVISIVASESQTESFTGQCPHL